MHLRYSASHEDADDTVVHVVHHIVEQLHAFEFEDEQRVFLFVGSVLHAVLEFVKFPEVLFPALVDDVQENHLLKLLDNGLAVRVVRLFEVARNVVHASSVGERHHDSLVESALVFIHLLYYRPCHVLYAFCFSVECLHHLLECAFFEFVSSVVDKLFLCERHFHSEDMNEFLFASLVVIIFDNVHHTVPERVRDIHSYAFSHEGMASFAIYDGTLFVHHVVIFEQSFTHSEVVFLHLALCSFYAL